jgi:hypothetical protein
MTIDERVAQLVAKAPPFTQEERTRLQELLVLVPCHADTSTRSGSNSPLRGRARATETVPMVTPMTARRRTSDNSSRHSSASPQLSMPASTSNHTRSA